MTKVTDTFDRADSSSLGASWAEVVGDWAIVSNQVECNDDDGATGYYARYETDVGSSDMYAEAVTNSTQTDGSSNAGVAVRMRSGANTSYQFASNLNDSHAFWRIVSGAETQIATFTATLASGDRVRLEAVGRTLRAKINDALVAVAQDTNVTTGQRAGLNGYNNVGTDVVRLNNFEGGALTDDLVAPYVADWSAQTARVTTATSTPTVPAQVAAGDLVCVHAVVRATTSAISAPAGEGWSQVELASGNSLRAYLFAKIWGLGGQTDDTTPDFTKDTGTVGFFTTAFVVRNPKHATAPWTSVSSAIVASGQQSNAAAATATAPSVTHTGNNRTVMRLYASADDNALATPSTGALIFGGASYDATDIAQAMSVVEDITVTTNTGTATVAETVNGNDASNGITLVLAVPSASTVNATAAAPLGFSAAAVALPTVNATATASLGYVSSLVATPTVNATLTATLGGTATATATRQTSATAAASLGGTATAAAAPQRSAIAAAALGGTATATATPTVQATLAASLGGSASATATRQTFPTAASSLGGTASATATRSISATATGALGGTASAIATRQTSATATALLGGSGTSTAIVTRSATAAANLGGTATATAGVSHAGTASSSLGFHAEAFATDGSVVQATAAAALGGAVAASATTSHIAQAVAALGGSANGAAISRHEAVLAALLGGTTTATGVVRHDAGALAAFGFTAAAVVGADDPNPAHVAFGDPGGFTIRETDGGHRFTEAVGVLFQEAAAA